MDEKFNMSVRKLLKQVGVTSQVAIEDAVRDAGGSAGKSFDVRVVLSIPELDLEHEVTGKISGEVE